ncbi:mitochondrial carrier domain-containing protein [Chytriomyces cf. hyalinus JEL632]|nr:mitochondrial carrier domain-containing protein [Chytriomyces cf. hyalinus JEL632]
METTATTLLSPSPHAKHFYNTSTFHNATAGFSGGVMTTAFLQPLDVAKIRFQGAFIGPSDAAKITSLRFCTRHLESSERNESRRNLSRDLDVITKDYGKYGMRGLYRGIVPSMWGASLSWGYFATRPPTHTHQMGSNNQPLTAATIPSKTKFSDTLINRAAMSNQKTRTTRTKSNRHLDNPGPPSRCIHNHRNSYLFSIPGFLTNPIWIMKVRFCADSYRDPNAYQTLREGLTKLYAREGIRGLYRGLVKVSSLSPKVFAMSITYPYQVVRARIQNQRGAEAGVYKSTLGTIRIIYRNEKIGGFYKGMGPNLIRILPGSALTFVVHESASKFCRLYLS